MTTITREFAYDIIKGHGYGVAPSAVEALAHIALASLEAEPVAWVVHARTGDQLTSDSGYVANAEGILGLHSTPLYAAPPPPAMPEKLPCSVELKPGLIIGKGCKTETLLTALKRRADFYAELDAMTPEERAEHDASIEAFKAMLPTPAPDNKNTDELVMLVKRLAYSLRKANPVVVN